MAGALLGMEWAWGVGWGSSCSGPCWGSCACPSSPIGPSPASAVRTRLSTTAPPQHTHNSCRLVLGTGAKGGVSAGLPLALTLPVLRPLHSQSCSHLQHSV